MAQPVSELWKAQLGQPNKVVYRVEILDYGRNLIASTEPGIEPERRITVESVNVAVDRTRNIWATCDATIVAPYNAGDDPWWLIPKTATDTLSPISGACFRVWAGFEYHPAAVPLGQDNPELVPCGLYDIQAVDVTHEPDGVKLKLSGQDLTGRLDVADIPQPVDIAWGSTVVDAAKTLLTFAIPDAVILAETSEATTARVVLDQQANRLAEIHKMMTSIGFEMYADPSGDYFRMRRVRTTEDDLQWTYTPGQFTVLTEAANNLSRERVYNGVIVSGENVNSTDPPVRAEAWDTDPLSPTHYIVSGFDVDTRIGPRPFFMVSQYIRTQTQAQDAANQQLTKVKGLLQRVSVTAAFNPAVNVGDVIQVTDNAIGLNNRYVVERLSWNSDGGPMQLSCEERRV